MLYHLSRRLFLENGPAAFAERVREASTTSDAYRVLQQAQLAASANCNAKCDAAA